MSGWLKRSIWLVAVFALVWLAVIIYWQGTMRLPSESDLFLYLGVLPLVVFSGGWGIHSLVTAPPRTPAPQHPGIQADPDELAAQTAKTVFEQERRWTLGIVATSLHTSQGASSAEVLEKLTSGTVQAMLDPELKTPEGFPVFAARIADLDFTATQDALEHWQAAGNYRDLTWNDQQYRTLHLAATSANELATTAIEHPEVQRYRENESRGRHSAQDSVIPLRLIIIWPARWASPHQAAASAWVRSLFVSRGWPDHRVVMQAISPGPQNPISLLDFVTLTAHRAKLPTLGILLACDSGIDQQFVDDLHANQMLYGGKNPDGLKPGELAAGLLFADSQHTQLLNGGVHSRLHRASWASHDQSTDAKNRTPTELLSSLSSLALDTAGLSVQDLSIVSSDNDDKLNRAVELAEMLNQTFPVMDFTQDVLKVAQVCGSMQQATTVAALCVAHQYVVDKQAPIMCLSLHDSHWRAAVVLSMQVPNNTEGLANDVSPA